MSGDLAKATAHQLQGQRLSQHTSSCLCVRFPGMKLATWLSRGDGGSRVRPGLDSGCTAYELRDLL